MVYRDDEMIKRINKGALLHYDMISRAKHIVRTDTPYYSFIVPTPGREGVHALFNIRFDGLDEKQKKDLISEIKNRRLHTWWNVDMTDEDYRLVYGYDMNYEAPDETGEFSMALKKEDWLQQDFRPHQSAATIKAVQSMEEFKIWADIVNLITEKGYKIVDPDEYYFLVQEKKMPCYLAYADGVAASAVCMQLENNIATIFFLSTLEDYRQQYLAENIAVYAIAETFHKGYDVITGIVWPDAKHLFSKLGFKRYA